MSDTITGKIYQMKNAAGNENRFPRTVIEAVYGLSSYLQQQFGALADIYMPIEGITESKTGQEFVYRKSAATIKAKSLTLDRIYGKTLAWNQLSSKSNVETTDFINEFDYVLIPATLNHKFYVTAYLKKSSDYACEFLWFGISRGGDLFGDKELISPSVLTTEYKKYSYIFSSLNEHNTGITLYSEGHSAGTISIKNLNVIDLTLMFGAGNEPSTVEEFESMFPGYHSYSAGKLISNDAESIETVGFNQWDEEWENMYYPNGVATPSNIVIGSKNLVPVISGKTYFFNTPYGQNFVCYYDAEGNYIVGHPDYTDQGRVIVNALSTLAIPSGVAFIRFSYYKDGTAISYNHDICINLSDPAKNGTYEPYRKSTMQLGLNSIKVKSHNIWDEEWEPGDISTTTGENVSGPTCIRSKNYIGVIPNSTVYFKSPNAGTHLYFYNQEREFLSHVLHTANTTFTVPNNAAYMRFVPYTDYGTTYNNDICINVSSSFNGQYEPYGDITVNGLKSAGSVKDEIVGNKYIKRVGSVDLGSLTWSYGNGVFFAQLLSAKLESAYNIANAICVKYTPESWDGLLDKTFCIFFAYTEGVHIKDSAYTDAATFKTAMDGVMLYYELATPIEYELAEPLVPTVKAGTTEARISPNADGLSAPMVADMTYDANANNDSASSQYALTAGRLLNSHTLWGQTFDGTQDVVGALTGVTNLNSLLYLGSTNVGIGQSSPSYKLDVAGTFRATGAATLGSTLSVSGNSTLSGTLTVGTSQSNKATTLNGTLDATGNTTIGGTLTVGTSSANKATTLYGTLTATGASYLDGTVRIGGSSGATFTWVAASTGLNINKGLYSDSYITAGASASSSDARLKDNIESVGYGKALTILSHLRGCEWTWNNSKEYLAGKHGSGLVAQEVQKVMPWAVLDLNGELSLNYNSLWGVAIPLMQSHEERLKEAERKIKALEDENEGLKRK